MQGMQFRAVAGGRGEIRRWTRSNMRVDLMVCIWQYWMTENGKLSVMVVARDVWWTNRRALTRRPALLHLRLPLPWPPARPMSTEPNACSFLTSSMLGFVVLILLTSSAGPVVDWSNIVCAVRVNNIFVVQWKMEPQQKYKKLIWIASPDVTFSLMIADSCPCSWHSQSFLCDRFWS